MAQVKPVTAHHGFGIPENPTFDASTLAEVEKIIKRYPEGKQKSAVLPVLHLAQAKWGWVSVPVMDYVASLLNIQPIEVYEVATFYTMFHLHPVGKYVIEVCRTGPCWLVGAEKTVKHLEHTLNIHVGETTADGMFTLKEVECLAACGFGPVCMVREEYFENLTIENTDKMIADLRNRI